MNKGMSLIDKLEQKEQEKKERDNTLIWKPKEGETIEGTVVNIDTTTNTWGEQKYIEVETAEGRKTVFLSKVLQEKAEKESLEAGDKIAIKFLGLVKSIKGSKKYKNFVVVIEHAVEETETAAEQLP